MGRAIRDRRMGSALRAARALGLSAARNLPVPASWLTRDFALADD